MDTGQSSGVDERALTERTDRQRKVAVNGDDLIYAFLQDLLKADDPALRHVPLQMLLTLGIWLPLDVYFDLPILVPWVVRDPTCRGGKGEPDQWSSPNEDGFLRDDNSKVKGIPKNLKVHSRYLPRLHGSKMGNDFVAAHVWRITSDGGALASRRPLLNSFVPNLVWLPKQIAKLTDREGSTVQRTLQAISWSVFRDAPVHESVRGAVEDAWSLLPKPVTKDDVRIETNYLNVFVATQRFHQDRHRRIHRVLDGLHDLSDGHSLAPKQLIDQRYTDGMAKVRPENRDALIAYLEQFVVDLS